MTYSGPLDAEEGNQTATTGVVGFINQHANVAMMWATASMVLLLCTAPTALCFQDSPFPTRAVAPPVLSAMRNAGDDMPQHHPSRRGVLLLGLTAWAPSAAWALGLPMISGPSAEETTVDEAMLERMQKARDNWQKDGKRRGVAFEATGSMPWAGKVNSAVVQRSMPTSVLPTRAPAAAPPSAPAAVEIDPPAAAAPETES
jgi:hypothetical protein